MISTIEQLSGIPRRELFLQLLKAGVKGNGLAGIMDGLLGQKPAPEAKVIRYAKVMAIWVPVFMFLSGCALIGVYLLYKLVMALTGGMH